MAKSPKKTPTAQPIKIEPVDTQTNHQLMQRMEETLTAIEERTVALSMAAAAPVQYYQPKSPGIDRGCAQPACCCCFEIFISRIRVIEGQGLLEPGDGGLLSQFLETFVAVTVDDITVLAGGLMQPIKISAKGSHWFNINRMIKTVTVKGTKSFPTMAEAREVGGNTVADNALEARPEFGASSVTQLILTCGAQVVPLQLRVDMTGGGNGGGAIEVEVSARETCCETC